MHSQRPYDGTGTFLNCLPYNSSGQEHFVVQGIAYDSSTTNRPGARMGPSAVRQASMMLSDGLHPIYLNNPRRWMSDVGNLSVSTTRVDKMFDDIVQYDLKLLSNMRFNSLGVLGHPNLITIGGDHSITYPVLRAMSRYHGALQVVHIDAHSDCSEENFGEKLAHGTWVRNAIEDQCIDATRMVSIGIRAPTSLGASTYLSDHGGTTITADEADSRTPEDVASQILLTLDPEKPTYLSFDIDGLDPAFAPGTGTPEVGGISTRWAISLIRALKKLNWVGMDVVEVAPAYDHSEITALAAATIIYNYACMNRYKEEQ